MFTEEEKNALADALNLALGDYKDDWIDEPDSVPNYALWGRLYYGLTGHDWDDGSVFFINGVLQPRRKGPPYAK